MNKVFANILLMLVCISAVSALICLRCDQEGDAPCTTLEQCQVFPGDKLSTEVCQNDYRIVNNVVTIRKKCKPRGACLTEEKLPDNNCDEHGGRNTVCRCCCETDKCNRLKKGCVYPSDCDKPAAPENGFKRCPNPFKRNQRCTFGCNPGYELKGNKATLCTRIDESGTLGLKPPTVPKCIRKIIRCLPPHTDPKNGKVYCQNSEEFEDELEFNYEGSRCRFECDEHHAMVGAERSACRLLKGLGRWTKPAPKCVRGVCPKLIEDKNRVDTCTEGNLIGSECEFECKKGYKLIGVDNNECERDPNKKNAGRWSKPPPKCQKIICQPEQVNPTHGSVKCTNKNFEDSVCTFTCDKGYDMDDTDKGTKRITCKDDDDGDALGAWSGTPPTCTIMKCLPQQTSLAGGNVKCTNKNFLGSVCTYTCVEGYDIVGTVDESTSAICQDDGDGDDEGKWSVDPPKCVRIVCEPPHTDPENGKVDCSKTNRLGSICTFKCNKFYDLDGTEKSTMTSKCVDDGNGDALGRWNGPPGTCTLKSCEPPHTAPGNGSMVCTNGNIEGSRCNFKCDKGYDLIGKHGSTCEDRKLDGDAELEWSSKAPVCEIGQCKLPEIDEEMLERTCGEGESVHIVVGTVCTYKCNKKGYYMTPDDDQSVVIKTGKLDAECQADKTWSKHPPNCSPVTCKPPLKAPDNGFPPDCTDGNVYGSVCTFRCKDRYILTHKDKPKCNSDDDLDELGEWSHSAPECELNECDDFGQVKYGSIRYTDGFKIGSVGHLTCDQRYTTKKYENITCIPPDRRIPVPHWDRRKYVCCVRCDFNSFLKFVMVVDKSMAEDDEPWGYVVDFMQYVLYYLHGRGYKIRFALVPYNEEVDEENVIELTALDGWETIDLFAETMFAMPRSGTKSNTANALRYASDKFFVSSSREEPYIALFTEAPTEDETVTIAKDIKEKETSILAVGFSDNKKSGLVENMIEVTGDEKNIFTVNSPTGIADFNGRMTKISMDNGCGLASKSKSCPK